MLSYLNKVIICDLYDKKLSALPKVPQGVTKGNEESGNLVLKFENKIIKSLSLMLGVSSEEIIEFFENPEFNPNIQVSSNFTSLSQTILALDSQEKYFLIPTSNNHINMSPESRYYKFVQVQRIDLGNGKYIINEKLIFINEIDLLDYDYYIDIARNIEKFKKENPESDAETLAVARARRDFWRNSYGVYQRYAVITNELIEDFDMYIDSFYSRYLQEFYEIQEDEETSWNNIRRIYDNRKKEDNTTKTILESYKLSLKK